ncbi:MAG TPA: DUF4334 domain-containing protein [Nocardioides sp.]|nr:DUF4334 domain-containing protein [Nocardioides sp.]
MTDLRTRFEALRDADHVDPGDLDELWAELDTATVEEILGPWRGGDFATGHVVSQLLEQTRWHGKRFDGPLDAKPLICRDEKGELYSNLKGGAGGEASLWMVGFRGEVTATMVYDNQPVLDHFKKVDGDTLMGIMNGKLSSAFGIEDLYYFWLEREA